MPQGAGKCISEGLIFKNFLGEHAPIPPKGLRLYGPSFMPFAHVFTSCERNIKVK